MRVILIGKAGSGKDYFRNFLADKEKLDVSYTSRPPREGEVDGYTYNFVSEEYFLKKAARGFFYEHLNFAGKFYGTSQQNWDTKSVFIMTPSGVKFIKPEDLKTCIRVYFDIPQKFRVKRLQKRSDWDSVDRRIKADEEDFKDFKDFDIRVTDPRFSAEKLYSTILTYAQCNNIKLL